MGHAPYLAEDRAPAIFARRREGPGKPPGLIVQAKLIRLCEKHAGLGWWQVRLALAQLQWR